MSDNPDVPSFGDLGLSDAVLKTLREVGYETHQRSRRPRSHPCSKGATS